MLLCETLIAQEEKKNPLATQSCKGIAVLVACAKWLAVAVNPFFLTPEFHKALSTWPILLDGIGALSS